MIWEKYAITTLSLPCIVHVLGFEGRWEEEFSSISFKLQINGEMGELNVNEVQ